MFQAEGYVKNMDLVRNVNKIHVSKLLAEMKWDFTNGNILDYGCGTGEVAVNYILPKLIETDSKLYSVDPSESMVNYARKHFAHPLIQYKNGILPSNNFPFRNIKFDKIVCINVFCNVSNIQEVLSQFEKILKPGGQIGITSGTKHSPGPRILSYLSKSPKWAKYMANAENHIAEWGNYENPSPEKYYRNYVEKNGLKIVHFDYKNQSVENDIDFWTGFFMAMNPFVPIVPEEMLDDLREEYRRFFLKTQEQKQNGDPRKITMNIEYLRIILEKPDFRE